MLDPRAREIYLDHLRPPQGYRLDTAVATTFSLDLMSLLMVPVAMALEDHRLDRRTLSDPVIVMEAIRQSAEHFAVFCQKGRIAVPKHDSLLYGFLERSVIEVQPPDPKGVFHPKTWLLRYSAEENAPVRYRFLCLSRNLTFDNSWDTVLALEGTLAEHRTYGYSITRPLVEFHKALPGFAADVLPQQTRDLVNRMADEVKRVQFEVPDGFDTIKQFIPVGIEGYRLFPRIADHTRALVLSPFLSPQGLERIRKRGLQQVVISRPEALDALSDKTFEKLTSTAECYFLDEAAERPEEAETEESVESNPSTSLDDFSGLHAKLIITENGSRAKVYTGSANTTSAALMGRNVEFMIALEGHRKRVGIEPFLGQENNGEKNNQISFRNMLRPYIRPEQWNGTASDQERLEQLLEQARMALSLAELSIRIQPNDQGRYSMELFSQDQEVHLPEPVRGTCFPITLHEHHELELNPLARGQGVVFPDVSAEALTSFMGFQLEAKGSSPPARIAFVLNVPVQGMPESRDKGILRSILSDRERFMRYLLVILGSESGLGMGELLTTNGKVGVKSRHRALIPLFEELVRAYSRDPEKIRRIGRLISDLQETGSLEEILPPGFEEVWAAFTSTANGGKEP